jgi:hypothetical protein
MPAERQFIVPFNDFMKSNDVHEVIVEHDDVTRWDGFLQAAGWVGQDIANLRLYNIPKAAWQAITPQDTSSALLDFDAGHLAALRQAAGCMLGHGAQPIDIPSAIGAHCLDKAYSPSSDGPHENWDCMLGWLGRNGSGIGIGVVVGGGEIPGLIGSLPGRAAKIYFPYPRLYDGARKYSGGLGQLLLVYDPDVLR